MWNLCGPWEYKGNSISEKLLFYSDAYLDSAVILCESLVNDPKKQTYSRGVVILYLTFHAVELFLKGAVLKKAPNELLNHKVEDYEKRYNNLYPAKRFKLDLPFKIEHLSFEPNEIAQLDLEIPSQDQVNRYPIDKNGNEWKQPHAFEPYSFQNTLNNLKQNLESVRKEIKKG